jgi:hypothetical protein
MAGIRIHILDTEKEQVMNINMNMKIDIKGTVS